MRKWLVFLLGSIVGGIFTIVTILTIAVLYSGTARNNGMTFFEQPGECLSTYQFEVLQAIGNNYALAYEQVWGYSGYINTDLLVLITNDNGDYYYDKQVIKIPKGKCMRQIGVYKYQAKSEIWKTVPIVKLMDK